MTGHQYISNENRVEFTIPLKQPISIKSRLIWGYDYNYANWAKACYLNADSDLDPLITDNI